MTRLSQDQIKLRLGEEAASLIRSGMKVGLGSGSTSHCFIKALAKRCKEENLQITGTASSKASAELAESLGLKIFDVDKIGALDLTVDGADEVDPQNRLIKGAGGAHVREKIVAAMSKELLIIVDESKLVSRLGKSKLPIEIIPFGHEVTKKHIEKVGYVGQYRKNGSSFYVTDNGNYILDIEFKAPLENPEACESQIHNIPGVIDTGFFFHLASRVLVGFHDGQIVEKSPIR
jgi:ribose 5-phosphate isomerase A